MQQEEIVHMLPVASLVTFPDHPFRVTDDEEMERLMVSIRDVGVVSPIIVRPAGHKLWQIISGHRRTHACRRLGIDQIPALIKNLDLNEATVLMVDSNFQRERILPSEKARAYKMKMEAMKRQGARRDLSSDHEEQKKLGITTRELLARESPDSATMIQRYIRLNELIPDLMLMVDEGRVSMTPAVELSYLTNEEQSLVVMTIDSEQVSPSLSQAQRIRAYSREGILTDDSVLQILTEKKKPDRWQLVLPVNRIARYFPNTYTVQEMQQTILHLLQEWMNKEGKI